MLNCKFESQKQIMRAIMSTLDAVGSGDETGMGGPICESLADEFFGRFKPVNFASLKTELGTLMIEVFEQGRQVIPLVPAEIGCDISGIRKDTSMSNKRIFTERPNELNKNSHCDMGWGCALAKYAGEKIDAFGPCKMAPAGQHGRVNNDFKSRLNNDYVPGVGYVGASTERGVW
jgi:phage FluMu gp28-like protein